MKKISLMLLVMSVLLFLSVTSHALQFEIGDASEIFGSAFQDPGLVMEFNLNPDLGSIGFPLSEGDSFKFLFATFYTNESWVNLDDKKPQNLNAQIDFDIPDVLADVKGTTVGVGGFFNFRQGWTLSWEDPVKVFFGSGNSGLFSIELSDADFTSYFWTGPDGTYCNPGFEDVYATVTLISDGTAPVPEPATMLLFGTGLLGLAGLRLRKKK